LLWRKAIIGKWWREYVIFLKKTFVEIMLEKSGSRKSWREALIEKNFM